MVDYDVKLYGIIILFHSIARYFNLNKKQKKTIVYINNNIQITSCMGSTKQKIN